MSDAAQSEILGFLADPATHGLRCGEVSRVRTHLAHVFLAGERVYKVKRAVRYAFVDFSSLAARRVACEAEVRLNARTAPELYLGLVAIRRTRDGRLVLDELSRPEEGEPVEWAVVMRRFDERLTFDRLAEQGALRADWIDGLIDQVTMLHASAEIRGAPYGGSGALARIIDENAADMAALPDVFAHDRIAALFAAQRRLLADQADLLDARRAAGQVRRCHGDLHLANVVLWHGRPTLFDCIEFAEEIASIDLAYDLAFLLMDLEVHDLRPFANRAMSRYFGRQDHVEALAALPLMLALRACVRAKVTAMAIAGQEDRQEVTRLRAQVARFLSAAERFMAPAGPPCLIAVGGLSGSGKTTLASVLAPRFGRPPGALLLRSDILRKRLAGVAPEHRLPASAYTPESHRRVYDTVAREALAALSAGYCAIADAVFARDEERRAIAAAARHAGARFQGIWLDAPAATLKGRVATRSADASDATPEVVDRQLGYETGEIAWTRIDAAAGPDGVLRQAKLLLGPLGA